MQVDAFKDSFDDPAARDVADDLRQWVYHHRMALIIAAVLAVLATAAGIWCACSRDSVTADRALHSAATIALTCRRPCDHRSSEARSASDRGEFREQRSIEPNSGEEILDREILVGCRARGIRQREPEEERLDPEHFTEGVHNRMLRLHESARPPGREKPSAKHAAPPDRTASADWSHKARRRARRGRSR